MQAHKHWLFICYKFSLNFKSILSYLLSGSVILTLQFEKVWEVSMLCFFFHSFRDFGQQTFTFVFWWRAVRARVLTLSFSFFDVSSVTDSSVADLTAFTLKEKKGFSTPSLASSAAETISVSGIGGTFNSSFKAARKSAATFCIFSSHIVININRIWEQTPLGAFILPFLKCNR